MIDNDKPVSLDLGNFVDEMPSYQEELNCWATRAHELWLSAAKNGDLRGQASALAVAFRGLQQRAAQQEESEAVTPLPLDMSEWSERDKTRLRDYFDRLISGYQEPQVTLDGKTPEDSCEL